jgi:hypothetical protein
LFVNEEAHDQSLDIAATMANQELAERAHFGPYIGDDVAILDPLDIQALAFHRCLLWRPIAAALSFPSQTSPPPNLLRPAVGCCLMLVEAPLTLPLPFIFTVENLD